MKKAVPPSGARCGIMIAGMVAVVIARSSVAVTQDELLAIARDDKQPAAKRNEAIQAIGNLPDPDQAITGLLDCLWRGETAQAAAEALSGTTVVAQQAALMGGPQGVAAQTAFTSLVRNRVKGAFDACVKLLSAPDYATRKRALDTLAAIRGFHVMQHPMIVPALPALVECAAKDGNLLLRLDAIRAIGSFGNVAAPAAAGLIATVSADPNPEVRAAVVQALGSIGSPECVPPLLAALDDGDDDVRYAAARGLTAVGVQAVDPLAKALTDSRAPVRRFAAYALAGLGTNAVAAAEALAGALKDPEELVRRNAADALGRAGDKTRLAALAALSGDPSLDVRLAAADALRMLGGADPEARQAIAGLAEKNRQPAAYPGIAKSNATVPDGRGVFFPANNMTPYATHHGEPPGYPGCLPGVLDEEGNPRYARWGNPELQPYPGSVEHYRTEEKKYLPPWTLFNARTLLKNFRATELPEAGGAMVEYAEPVYWTPMYGQSRDTGKRNPPVKVVRTGVGKPAFALDLGTLDIGLYVVRAIGAVEGNPTGYRAPLYFDFRVNDLPGDPKAMRRYRLRVGYVDEFYSLAEFYFYAPAKRVYQATMAVGERSEVQPLLYNFDLHDAWSGCQLRPVKSRTTGSAEERDVKRAQVRRRVEAGERVSYHCGALGNWQPRTTPLPPEERLRRDRDLWDAFPPLNRNSGPGYSDQPIAGDDGWRDVGGIPGQPTLRNDAYGLRYTADDLLNFRALPDPYPNKDDGGAVFLPPVQGGKYPQTFLPIARMIGSRMDEYAKALNGLAAHHPGLADVYLETGDESAARDAALMLVRLAYAMPALDGGRQQVTMAIAGNSTDLQWGGKDHWTRRRLNRQNRSSARADFMGSYDKLYDYIRGNGELARAVSRFIPWVRTPEDVIAFIDCSYQHYVKRCVHWHYDTYGGMSESMIQAVMEIGDWPFTRPWMEWVFRETWKYPNARAGLPDYATTSTTRDGTSYIGSWSYGQDRPALDYAKLTEAYVAASGQKAFDLSDPARYPKALAGCAFDFEGRAAGLHVLGIGDVNGPAIPHGHQLGANEERMRVGWRWSRDPRFAYALAYYHGRKAESDAEWAAITNAAARAENPWFAQRSRVLSSWAGILESGVEHNDFRFRRAAMVRLGYGWGHQHDDTLDLILWCHGLIHAAEGGERPEKRSQDEVKAPADQKSFIHNVVEVDGDGSHRSGNWRGHSWAAALKETAGARYLDAVAAPGINHPYVSLFRRQVALIDVDEGRPSAHPPKEPREMAPGFKLDPDVVAPDAYVFDVFRVSGGRRHTYCFHGPSADRFLSNAREVREVPWGATNTPEARYLKAFLCPDNRTAGKAPAVLDASWRVRREEGDVRAMLPAQSPDGAATYQPRVAFRTGNAEAGTLGPNYNPAAPPTFTRLLLFGQEGARVMTGKWIASAPAIAFDCLYTQRETPAGREITPDSVVTNADPGNLQSVFPAVIEMYAGEPIITGQRRIPIPDNEEDALAAAAVELTLRGGRTDICFADGRPEKVRDLSVAGGASRVSAEFAYWSVDAGGLRQATLVGGRTLSTPPISLETAARERTAVITKIDYPEKKAWIDRAWPKGLLDGQAVEIGTEKRRTSYMVKSAEPAGGGSELRFDKGMDYYASLIKEVNPQMGVVLCGLGFPTDDGAAFPGLSEDVVVSNAERTKFWRGRYLGGTREDGFRFKLEGAVAESDFPGRNLRVWEIGAGDRVRIPTHVSLRRLEGNRYELRADTAFRLKQPGLAAARLSADGSVWREIKAGKDGWIEIMESDLGAGKLILSL